MKPSRKGDLPQGLNVDRYNPENIRRLSYQLENWDFFARMLLQFCCSDVPPKFPANMDLNDWLDFSMQIRIGNPTLINMNCIAMCKVDNCIYMASNGVNITVDKVGLLKNLVTATCSGLSYLLNARFYAVRSNNKVMHAEMCILSTLYSKGILPRNLYEAKTLFMGVSKPCCWRCATHLGGSGLQYTGWHNDPLKA